MSARPRPVPRTQIGRAAAALAAVGTVLMGIAAPSAADVAIVETAWWSDSPTASAPEGGLVVGASMTGTSSVGAIRVGVGRGVRSATLTLVETGGRNQDAGGIQACVAADDWSAGPGGSLDDAPEWSCVDPPIELTRDGGRWTADVTPLLAGRSGAASIMVVPADDLDLTATLGLGFEAQFGRPALQATEEPPPAPLPSSTSTTAPPAAPPPAVAPPTPGPTPQPRPAQPPAFDTPGAPATVETIPAAEPSPTTTTTPPPVDEQAAPLPLDEPSDGKPWGRLLFYLPLSAVVGVAVRFLHARLA